MQKKVDIGFSLQLGLALTTNQGGFFRITVASIIKRSYRNVSASLYISQAKHKKPYKEAEMLSFG